MLTELQTVTPDAIEVLGEDHREMARLFKEFFAARTEDRRLDLVAPLCRAVKVHMRVEREVFLPACAEILGESERWSAMAGEAADLEELADELLFSDPGDLDFSASAFTLSRLVSAHIDAAERSGGMFDRIAASSMDLAELGERLADRRDQLMEANRSAWDGRGRYPASGFTPR